MNTNELLKHTEELDQIISYTTLLSNNSSNEWKSDCKKIIDFICNAYNLAELTNDYSYIITEEISNLCLLKEYNGIKAYKSYDEEYSDLDLLYDIKGKIIHQIAIIARALYEKSFIHADEFNYDSYFPYFPKDRFKNTLQAANYGNVVLACQVGLMYSCGIGCEKNLDLALLRFKQCAFWGYIPALKYITYVYRIKGNEKLAKVFEETYELCNKYLNNGITLIPTLEKSNYSDEATLNFSIITSIYQDVVLGFNHININYSFLEVIFLDNISYKDKMKYINEYNKAEWKDVTNEGKKPNNGSFGFKLY